MISLSAGLDGLKRLALSVLFTYNQLDNLLFTSSWVTKWYP